MRLEGCKRKLPQWHTDYTDAHRFLFRSMLIAHLSPLVMFPNRKDFHSDALKYSWQSTRLTDSLHFCIFAFAFAKKKVRDVPQRHIPC